MPLYLRRNTKRRPVFTQLEYTPTSPYDVTRSNSIRFKDTNTNKYTLFLSRSDSFQKRNYSNRAGLVEHVMQGGPRCINPKSDSHPKSLSPLPNPFEIELSFQQITFQRKATSEYELKTCFFRD